MNDEMHDRKARTPDWLKAQRRVERALKGNPTGWGGKRPGAGRKKSDLSNEQIVVKLNITRFQQKILLELGEGSLLRGIQKLIDDNV